MNISFSQNNDILTIVLDGRLDTATFAQLENVISKNYSGGSIVIDCKKLEYVSSAGLRVLLAAQKKTKGSLKLTGVSELVMEVFEITGFVDILVIE